MVGTAADKAHAEGEADDINASDMDMVDLPSDYCPGGCTWVVWLTGNQCEGWTPAPWNCLGFQGAGIINATQREWLESFWA